MWKIVGKERGREMMKWILDFSYHVTIDWNDHTCYNQQIDSYIWKERRKEVKEERIKNEWIANNIKQSRFENTILTQKELIIRRENGYTQRISG